mmetsp:Transcript_23614/g.49193  ORF Transcript_23614/g.49193 Transcript_23614/m.49193 type:complete len:136 (+) Transcript_23614:479-886(+)
MVDAAMVRCGYNFPATKGYHFLDAPCVEYKGTVEAEKRPGLIVQLNEKFKELIDEDIPTTICQMTKEDAEEKLNKVQENFDPRMFTDPTIRVVGICGFDCCCGGTHVKSSKELEGFKVTGIKCKKGITKVKYNLG